MVLLGLTASGTGGPPLLRFAVVLCALAWFPGAVLLRRVFGVRCETPFVEIPLQFFTGVSFVSVVVWVLASVGAGLGTCTAVLEWAACAVLAAGWVADIREREGDRVSGPRRVRWHWVLLAALAVFAAVRPVTLDVEQDAYDHIGYIRQITTSDELVPAGVLAAPVDERVDPTPPDPRKGTFHDFLAVACSLTGMEPIAAWAYLPILLFPLAFFAFLGFCREFIGGGWSLVACALLFGMSFGGIGYRYASTVAYGQNLSLVWYWLLVPVALAAGNGTKGRTAALAAALTVGGVWVHYGVALHAVVLSVTLVVFGRTAGARRAALAVAAGAIAAGAWKYASSHGTVNAIHAHAQGLLYVSKSLFVVSPIEILREHGLLFLGGLATTPILVAFARRSAAARRELAFVALPLVLCFFAPLTTPLVHALSYMVSRSLLNAAVFPMIATTVACTVGWSRRGGWPARVAGAGILIAWALLFFAPTARALARDVARGSAAGEDVLDSALARYVRHLPVGSVILSDPKTSYQLSAVADQRFVCVYGQHGNPYDPYALDRLEAVRDVLSPYVVSRATIDACRRYGVDFVVVNGGQRSRAADFLSEWNSASYGITALKLAAIEGRFREVQRGGDFAVFLYDSTGVGQTVWGPPATPLRFDTDARVSPCTVEPDVGAFTVAEFDLSPDVVLPGETVTATVGYRAYDRTRFGFPYSLYVRLDHLEIARLGEYPFSKQVRRFRERREGMRIRDTVRHRPFVGMIDADMWPIGATFYESFELTVPSNMKPGSYFVELTVERDTLLPNFTLSDLLYNRDRFTSPPCDTLTVTRQRTSGE